MITCAKCGSKVGVSGPCRTCDKRARQAENATLRAENARLREALETVRAEERARCVGIVEGMPNHKSASMFGSFEGRVEHLDAITRADVVAALTGGPHE